MDLTIGQRVKVGREKGFYWVKGIRSDGSVDVWGGDKDPGGLRKARTVSPQVLKEDTRKLERKLYPEFAL